MSAHQRPVIILSCGRSGSTLLQRILNASPALTIWGEHGGFLAGIASSYHQFHASDEVARLFRNQPEEYRSLIGAAGAGGGATYWHNCIDGGSFRTGLQKMIIELFSREVPRDVRWGFKEVRYGEVHDGGEVDHVVGMLDGLFPDAQFLILARSPEAYARSALLAWEREVVTRGEQGEIEHRFNLQLRRWRGTNSNLLSAARLIGGTRAKVLNYDSLIANPSAGFGEVFEFLGESVPAALDEVLAERPNASSDDGVAAARLDEIEFSADDACRSIWDELCALESAPAFDPGETVIPGSVRVGGGLFESPWFGTYMVESDSGFVRSTQLGWCRIGKGPEGGLREDGGVWLWREGAGWLFTSSARFPAFFSQGIDDWVTLDVRRGAEGEFRRPDGSWVAVDQLSPGSGG